MTRELGLRFLTLALVVPMAAACGDDDEGPTGLDPSVFEIVRVSGNNQTGLAGTVLFEPLFVQVRNRENGSPEEGAIVSWRVTDGSGSPTRASSATDADGLASTRMALGATGGEVRVAASVAGLPDVRFTLTALPAPTLESVTPTSADPGDTVEVRVADLPSDLAARVLFDGEAGGIVGRTDGATSVLDVVVPPPAGVCDATVDRVDVRVRVGSLTTAARTIDVTVPADPFRVGQVLVIEGTSDVQCALLPAADGTARYLLVALSGEFETAGEFQVTLGSSSVAVTAADAAPASPSPDFHNRLRALGSEIARRGLPAARPGGGAGLFAQPDVGSEREFWVLNNTDFNIATELDESDFDRITATLEFRGVNTLLYVDNQSPSGGLTQSDIEFLGELYDRRLFDADVDFFGQPTDVDGNERIVILLSPVVNALTPRGSEGIIVGFFFGLDLVGTDVPNCDFCQFSNESEMFYGVVPDPNGDFSDDLSRERVRNLLPGVMVHEMQHMINFRFKVFVHATDLEALWLAEGMAHMAEEFGGDETDLAGQTDVANQLYAPNFGRSARFLIRPDTFSLTVLQGQGNLGERGAAWLFMRWIAEQYGDFIMRDLTQSPEFGIENVEAQTGESMFRLFADWAIALWADDQTIPGLAERYQIPKWQLRDILQIEPSNGGPSVYALQPLEQTFGAFRTDTISRFLKGSSPFYVELDAAGDMQDLQLELDADASAGLAILRFE